MRLRSLATVALVLASLAGSPVAAEESNVPTPLAAVQVAPSYAEQTPPGVVVLIRSRTQRNLERLGRVLNYYMAQKYSQGG